MVTGRFKNLIIRGGENISPVEIERAIKEVIGKAEVKVFGVPTIVLQEEIVACIEGKGSEDDRMLTTVPLFHTFGITGCILAMLHSCYGMLLAMLYLISKD